MGKLYEVLFYNGDGLFPAYYLIEGIEEEIMENMSKNKIAGITQRVREMFHLGDDFQDRKIHEALFVLKEDGLIPIKNIT